MLMEQCPKLGLVVDLTNTNRYYNGQVFMSKGIKYKKINCPGHVVPAGRIVKEFFNTVDAFLNESDEQDKLVGVHCTHGLNRTGYFICRYLNLRMGFAPQDAITAFENARGYKIEREPYIQDIVSGREVDDGSFGPQGESWKICNGPISDRDDPFRRYQHSSSRDNQHRQFHHGPARQNDFYPPQPPVSRRNSLVFESPLSNSYDDYVAPSRYSRGYGNTANGPHIGKIGHQSRLKNRDHPFEHPNRQTRVPQNSNNEYSRRVNSDAVASRGRGFVQKYNTHQATYISTKNNNVSRPQGALTNTNQGSGRKDGYSYR
ncbi:uncharacterized protein [Periplaneta americana]